MTYWITNWRTDGWNDASANQKIIPKKHFNCPLARSLKCFWNYCLRNVKIWICQKKMLSVIDLLFSNKGQISGNWAKKRKHLSPNQPACWACVCEMFLGVFLVFCVRQYLCSETDRQRRLQTIAMVQVWLNFFFFFLKSVTWNPGCLNVLSSSKKPQICDAVTGTMHVWQVQHSQFGIQWSVKAKRCC